MAAALAARAVAAPAVVPETLEARACEVALVPGDEDDRVPGPGTRTHDRGDRALQEPVTGRDQGLHLREVARTGGRRTTTVHAGALVRADQAEPGPGVSAKVSEQTAQVND